MHTKRLSLTLPLTLALTLTLFASLSLAAPGNPDPAPAPNTHTAPPTTTVSLTYDEDMDAATVSTQTFAVHAFQTGLLTATFGVGGNTILVTPTRPFFPGELVQTTATTRTLSITGEQPLSYTVWGFRVAAQGGSGAYAPHPISPTFGAGDSRDVALGDVDGDGDLDALVANSGTAQEVYLNGGDGVFAAHPSVPTFGAGASYDVALGDVDGDGDLDAVVANYTGEAQDVYLNDGSGAFAAHPSSPTFGAGNSQSVALGDVDGDGDLDAIVANYLGTTQEVYLNDGGGVFSAHPISLTFGAGYNSKDVALGDVDGDGDLDALVANRGAAQEVYLNDGIGVFNAHPISPTFGTDGNGQDVALGDVDGDGDLDAIIANWGTAQEVHLNDGSGVFSAHPVSPTFGAGNSAAVTLGDVDGDGDLDAIVANRGAAQEVYLNDGDGAFSLHPSAPTFDAGSNSSAVALGDMDGDGDLDAFVTNYWGDAHSVWLNRNRVSDVAPAPNSHDAALDTGLAITASGPISLTSVTTRSLFVHGGFHGRVSGTISSGSILYDPDDDWFPGEAVHTSVTGGVLDSVGVPIIPYVWGFRAAAQGGSGAFAAHPISPAFGAGDSLAIALGDVDGDGDLDALVANFRGAAQDVYLNNGDGVFSPHPISSTFGAGWSYDVALGDLDGDGDLDAIVANLGEAQDVYLNDGSGAFSAHPISPTFGAGDSVDVALGDLDGDGDLDAIVANYSGVAQDVYLNDGGGVFRPHPISSTFGAGWSAAAALGDVDGDGDLDAIVANDNGEAQDVYLNDGRGVFSPHPSTPTFGAGESLAVALGDVDGDGDLDAIVANSNNQAQVVYLNDGGGAYAAHPSAPTFGAGDSHDLALGDVDGDNDLDAIVANFWGEAQDVYLNDGAGVFRTHPSAPTFGAGRSQDVALGDVDGDGDLDALIANHSDQAQTVWLNRDSTDLSITKSVQATAAPGGLVTYTITFVNNGPQAAGDVVISDAIVAGRWALIASQESVVGGQITRTEGVTFEWTMTELVPGQGGAITITGVLTSPLAAGTFSNTISIASTALDTDTSDNSASAKVTVSNIAPAAMDDGGAEYATDEDSAFSTGEVLANDDDLNGDTLTVASFDASGALGLVSDNGDGTFGYDPGGQFEGLAANQQAVDAFTYVVSDGELTATATVSVTITGANDPPTVNDDSGPDYTTDEDTPFTTGDVLDNDDDPDTVLSVSSFDASGTLGLVSDNGDGTFDYDPNGQFEYLAVGQQAFDTFSYVASDGSLTGTAGVSITINGVNDAPTISDILNQYTDAGTPLGPLSFSVGDVDSALETLSLDAASSDSALVDPANVSFGGSGTEHTLTLTPTAGMTGTATITVSVSDGALVAWDSFILTVSINAPPNALDDAASTPQGTPVAITVLDNDSDPNGDALSVIAVGQPGNGQASSDGLAVVYTPTLGFVGTDAFTYTVSDGELSDTATVSVQVLQEAATSDLAISQSYERSTGVVTYTVVARNLGPSTASGAVVTSALSLNVSGVSWTCMAAGGASCTASGAGNTISDTLTSFPAGGVVTYIVGGALDSSDNAINTASIAPPVGVVDLDMENNSDTLLTASYRVFLPWVVRNTIP